MLPSLENTSGLLARRVHDEREAFRVCSTVSRSYTCHDHVVRVVCLAEAVGLCKASRDAVFGRREDHLGGKVQQYIHITSCGHESQGVDKMLGSDH